MKNEYGVINPKELQMKHYIQKFNEYVEKAVAKGKDEFDIYAFDDFGLCEMLSGLEKSNKLGEVFNGYDIHISFDEYDNVDYVYVSW